MVVTALPDLPEPTVIPVLRAATANQAQMELLVEMALPERQVLTARPALKGPKGIKVEPETANGLYARNYPKGTPGAPELYSR